MTTPPHDDLTAERAAQLYGSLTCTTYREGYQDPENDIALIAEELKTARQEALREAAKVCRSNTYMSKDALDGGAFGGPGSCEYSRSSCSRNVFTVSLGGAK